MIGPLLLFYDKIAISNPVGNLLVHSQSTDPKTTLFEGELKNYIKEGVIKPLGYETFFDPEKRRANYPRELQPSTELDNILLHSKEFKDFRIILDDSKKYEDSNWRAVKLINNNPHIRDRLVYIFKNQIDHVPKRYQRLANDEHAFANSLKQLVRGASPAEMFCYSFVYDQFNNSVALSAVHEDTKTNDMPAHALHNDYSLIFTALDSSLALDQREFHIDTLNTTIIGEVLKEAVGHLNTERLSKELIDEFRDKHRPYFLHFIIEAMNEISDIDDPDIKREKIRKMTEINFKWLETKLEISPEFFVKLFAGIARLQLPEFSSLLDRRTNEILTSYRVRKKERWLFHFLNKGK